MFKLRTGNDTKVVWSIFKNNNVLVSGDVAGTDPEDFSDATNITMSIGLRKDTYVKVITDFSISGNTITVNISKDDMSYNGRYYLVLNYDKPDLDFDDGLQHYCIDVVAFDLVAWSEEVTSREDIILSSTTIASNEQARLIAESGRVTAEVTRINNEATRISQESGRVTAEQSRVTVEQARVTAEQARASSESTRGTNESTRLSNETARGSAESSRVTAETSRVTSESTRSNNETARISTEASRVTAETARNTAENTRGTNESSRVTAETARTSAETTRGTNEAARVASEASRVTAEQARETFIGTVSGRIVTLESTSETHTTQITELERKSAILYGVEFTRGLDPAMTRWIGSTAYQSNHFVLDMFKVAKVKDGVVIGYLNQSNWFLMEDGTDSNIIIDGTIITDDGSDIMLVNPSSFYAILGGTNKAYERRLVGKVPFMYDGDVAIEIPAHGVCVDFSVIRDGKQRCIRDNTLVGTGGAGINLSYLADALGCPTSNLSRFVYEADARAKNTDTSKNLPYCNNFWLDIDVWHTLLCIKFKTKDYHNNSICGKAISSNDATPTVANWGTQTGVRVTNTGGTYSYYQISSSRFSSGSGVAAITFWVLLNNNRPLLKMLEAQLALSYAKANSIAANTDFTYDGATYSYVDIAGHSGLASGEMTARVRKTVTVSFTGYDVTNAVAVTDMPITYLLESVVIKGRYAGWGHLYRWNSGLDCTADNTNYTFYQTTDVTKITTDTDVTEKSAGESFAFESVYDKIGSIPNGEGWTLRANNDSLFPKTTGGGLHTAECFYSYRTGTATAGKKARKGVSFGAYAAYSFASLRFCYAFFAPSFASTSIAGGFRVAL